MNNELVIDVQSSEVAIALLEEGKLVEIHRENRVASFSVGDIYLAKVRKIMPGLNAVFVDVGYDKGAFLHYQDLGPQFSSLVAFTKNVLRDGKRAQPLHKMQLHKDISKTGMISDVLAQGQEIMVQIAKEPISTKGPRLTSEISLAGRFLVLMPFAEKVYVSQKIKSSEERNRIKQLMRSIKPKNFGVIVRTVAEGKKVAELDAELKTLLKRWDEAVAKMARPQQKLPALLLEEMGRTVSLLRDIFNPSFENIYVNNRFAYGEICDYVDAIAPECSGRVKMYSGDLPIFDHFGISKQVKSGFGRTVSFKNGAYLIIEHTEAMHVIDVNSGNKSKGITDQETNAVDVNLAAADEIARQLRLRDMGGIIVIDFIDMQKSENRQRLFDRMKENMAHDRARHNILQLSKFGLMQITRQRVRPEMHVSTEEVCPTCLGKGFSQPSILFVDKLEDKIDYLVNELNVKNFKLFVHSYVEAYITKGFPFCSIKWKWRRKYGKFKIVPSQSIAYLQYLVLDKDGHEIDLREDLEAVNAKK